MNDSKIPSWVNVEKIRKHEDYIKAREEAKKITTEELQKSLPKIEKMRQNIIFMTPANFVTVFLPVYDECVSRGLINE